MKRAVICGACKTLTRAALTYQVRVPVERTIYNPDGSQGKRVDDQVMHICHKCAAAAGYKVRGERVKPADPGPAMFPEGGREEAA
jgi:RNase P subunit RPR2